LERSPLASPLPRIGWREYLAFPDLGIDSIKAKIDTGARSSALHAFEIHGGEDNGVAIVQFKVHPQQRSTQITIATQAPLWEERTVKNSGGHAQLRPVIRTAITLGGQTWPIDLTLTRRDAMGFRLLLGREAIRHRFWVDPGRSYLQSVRPPKQNPSLTPHP